MVGTPGATLSSALWRRLKGRQHCFHVGLTRRMEAAERRFPRWVLVVALLPGLLNLIPHLQGYSDVPEGEVYLGFRHQTPDLAQYMALATGEVALENPFVTDRQDGRFVLGWLTVVGTVHNVTGLDRVAAYHTVGVLSAWAFFLVVWLAAGRWLSNPRVRRFAFLLACFSVYLVQEAQ